MSCVTGMGASSPSTCPTRGRSASIHCDAGPAHTLGGEQGAVNGGLSIRVISGDICWAKGVPAISRRRNCRTAEPETSRSADLWSPIGCDRQEDADDQERKTWLSCYDPAFEHDSCGVAFVVDLKRPASHRVVALGLTALENLAHRGAFGADPGTGDGAGALVQVPHRLYSQVAGVDLPEPGSTAPGWRFSPKSRKLLSGPSSSLRRSRWEEGLEVLGWREVPVELSAAGEGARAVASEVLAGLPRLGRRGRRALPIRGDALERRCFVAA